MVALAVIMLSKSKNRLAQRVLAEENQALEALRFQAPVVPFQVRIQVGRSCRQYDWLDAGLLQQRAKLRRELGVPIHEDIALALQKAIVRSRQVARYLLHPRFCRAGGAAAEDSRLDRGAGPHLGGRFVDRELGVEETHRPWMPCFIRA